MQDKIPHMDNRSGKRMAVTYAEKTKWIEKWPEIRARVPSNEEAYQALSGLGLRYRDPRTIKTHMEKLLPLVNTKAISAIIDLINDCESRMPTKEFMRLIREKFPAEELGPKFANLAEVLIKELPPPGQVIQALGSILSGGFPFDSGKGKK
jgi:carbamoylphosphate synthase large subunit